MKKLFCLITCGTIILIGHVYAQKARLGFTAGATVASYKIKAQSVSVTSKGKTGITVGLLADIPLGSSGSFMPALNFVQKGGKLNEDGMNDKLTTNYLEVPLNVAYNLKLRNGKFFIGAGPALNMGLSGKDKWSWGTESGSDKIKFGKDKDFRRFDAALNFVTGFVGKGGMMVSFNYNTGLTNAVDPGEGDGKFKNRYFGLRVGYML
ncbi:MAG TPA: porin family protein [Chitinophagaceae bacterium]|nr:porin family protein [Chitinophagaceae bacterium]